VNDRWCFFCNGSGSYASPMTNWDAVPCDRCNGTGMAPLVQVGEAIARHAIAALDAAADDRPLLDPAKVAYGRQLFATGRGR
jgi:hypothetical protein